MGSSCFAAFAAGLQRLQSAEELLTLVSCDLYTENHRPAGIRPVTARFRSVKRDDSRPGITVTPLDIRRFLGLANRLSRQ